MRNTLHKSDTRGNANHGWLKSKHTFSFANYYNPERINFGALRVINDDIVAPLMGFGTHPHENMEIVSVPLRGSLKHVDTMGNDFVIRKGEIQVMSAGTGVAHSEYNHSSDEDVNFLQIWVIPKKLNISPRYSQVEFFEAGRENKFQLIISPDGRENSVTINQDAYFSLTKLEQDANLIYSKYQSENGVYLFVLEGEILINNMTLGKRDGLGIEDMDNLSITATNNSEILVMEVPMLKDLK